jgi:2-polyprenyl-6-methoxyphenol hydroxylase-like FAD-dependent oxidoreductase
MAAFLTEYHVCTSLSELSFKSSGRQYVDKQGQVIGGDDEPQLFSAWDVLYRALRAAVPDESYRAGCAVESIDNSAITDKNEEETPLSLGKNARGNDGDAGFQLTIKTSTGETLSADLLIGADGPGSVVRSHFLPDERSEYQGYVAWRGVLLESEAPVDVLKFLGQKFTVYRGDNFHILAYLIPGFNGEIETGKRRVNWVWYCNYKEESLAEILADKDGRRHGYSVPKGYLKAEIAEKVKENSKFMLPGALSNMVCATEDIFVQAIHDYLASQLVFNDCGVLIGDAGCILRPHTAAGTTKAAVNAWALADCLKSSEFKLQLALKKYNESMLQLGQELVDVGVQVGTTSQFPERG